MGFMTSNYLPLLLPYIVLAITIIVVMLTIAFHRRHGLIAGMSLLGIAATFLTLPVIWQLPPGNMALTLVSIDHLGLLYTGILLLAAFVVVLISYTYLQKHAIQAEEYYLLLLLATLGAALMVVSKHFV
jgi:NADH-quinone oxidoreductase subunit N